MLKLLASVVAIILLTSLSPLKADEPLTAPKPASVTGQIEKTAATHPWLRVRIVHDLVKFDLSKLNSETKGAWIVARILPGGLSGGLFLQGMYIKDGKAYDSGIRPREVIRVGGQWWLIETLSGKIPPRAGRFQWQEPHRNFDWDRTVTLMEMSSVFTNPKIDATVVCQFFEQKSGAARFADVTCIPQEWKSFVKPAMVYQAGHADEWAEKDLDELQQLATGENPFLALIAIDHLLSNPAFVKNPDKLADLMRSLPRYRQAVLLFKLEDRRDLNHFEIVSNAIDRAQNTAELSGIPLGLWTWEASHPMIVMGSESMLKLMEAAREKYLSFDPNIPDDWMMGLNHMFP